MDLNGWDTIFTASAVDINAALASPQTLLSRSFEFKYPGAAGAGTLSRWSIVDGGSEGYLLLRLEIASGTFSLASGNPIDIAGSAVVVRVELKVLPTQTGGQDRQLVMDLSTTTPMNDAPVEGVSMDAAKLSPLAREALCRGIAASLCAQASSFSLALAAIDPSIGAGNWAAPVQHACIYVRDKDGGAGTLAILATVSDRDVSGLERRLPPELAPASSGMRVVMTNALFLRLIVAPAIAARFGVDADGFAPAQDGTIQYSGGIDLPAVKEVGLTYHPVIDQVNLSIDNNQVVLKLSGHCDMHANIVMRFTSSAQMLPQIDPSTGALKFALTGTPSFDKDVDIPWYDYLIAAASGLLAVGIGTLIYEIVRSGLSHDISESSGDMTDLSPLLQVVRWYTLSQATLSDCALSNVFLLQANLSKRN